MCKSVKLFHLLLRTEKRSWAFRKWQIDTTFVSVILTYIKRKWTLKVLCKCLKSVIEFLLSYTFLQGICKNMYELGGVNYWNTCKQKMKIQRSISKDKKKNLYNSHELEVNLLDVGCLLFCSVSMILHCFNKVEVQALEKPIHEWWCSTVWFCCCFFSIQVCFYCTCSVFGIVAMLKIKPLTIRSMFQVLCQSSDS